MLNIENKLNIELNSSKTETNIALKLKKILSKDEKYC